jgi:dihydropteroate synthase
MELYRLGTIADKKRALKRLGVDGGGVTIMNKKMKLLYFYIKDLKTPAVNILKQDALSIGAELAVPSGVILCQKESYDCILIANQKQIELLSRKELAQPFGLKEVAKALQRFVKEKAFPLHIMGVINTNDDSFYTQSRFKEANAITAIEKMITEGATIIDIGAVSSRPGAIPVTVEEELARVQPICDLIQEKKLYEKVTFSIDSYTPKVVEYALRHGFRLINDITGASNDNIIQLAKTHHAKLCIMHMQGTPQTMQKNPHYDDVMVEVTHFFEERIAKCEALGLLKNQLILDVGIGFGKTLSHNVTLIRNMIHFKQFGCELLIGASRKSMIDAITPTPVEERLPGTLALHLKAVEQGATIVRCHDVAAHKQAFTIWEACHHEPF